MLEVNNFVMIVKDEKNGGNIGIIKEVYKDQNTYKIMVINEKLEKENALLKEEKLKQITTKRMFNELIDIGLENEKPFMYVVVKTEGFNDVEVVVTPLTNFEEKMEYYNVSYDENLFHKYANIKIKSFGLEDSMEGIEKSVFGEEDDKEEIKFKKGGKARAVNDLDNIGMNGMVGTALYTTDDFYSLKNQMQETSDSKIMECNPCEVEIANDIRVGDMVRVKDAEGSYSKYNGEEGKVVDYFADRQKWQYDLQIDGEEKSLCFSKEELELL